MNWTGGSLQRHSKKTGKDTVNRQWQHFAKARTVLQNGSNALTTPFHPNYLCEQDGTHGPVFGPRRVRQRANSWTLRGGQDFKHSPPERRHHIPSTAKSRDPAVAAAQQPRLLSLARSTLPNKGARGRRERAERRKSKDSDGEIELLEANRQRLLERQDWIGLAPSRPVHMAFASIKDKSGIAKRRKADRRARLQQQVKAAGTHQTAVDFGDYHHPRAFADAAAIDLDDIRIRIGTDALASQTSMQLSDHAQSERPETPRDNSSEPMLFDHEPLHSAFIEPMQTPRSVREHQVESLRSLEKTHRPSQHRSVQGNGPRLPKPTGHQRETHTCQEKLSSTQHATPEASDHDGRILHDSVQAHVPANARRQNEEIGPSLLIKQHIGGIGGRPLRLIFDETSDNVGGSEHAVADVQEANAHSSSTRMRANADICESRHAHGAMRNECRSAGKVSASHLSIVEDAAWRAFVEVPAQSSTATTTSRPVLSRVPRVEAKSDYSASRGLNWSRHASLGDETDISVSSSTSASLPCTRRIVDQDERLPALQTRFQNEYAATRRRSHESDGGEEFWKTFVFEGGDHVASETPQENVHKNGMGLRPTSSTRNGSRLHPSCVGVEAVVGSTDVPTHPKADARHRSRISYDAHIAQEDAPFPTSLGSRRQLPSCPATAAYVHERFRQDERRAEEGNDSVLWAGARAGLGEAQLVTHASLFNDVSHDTFSSGTFGSGLDHASKTGNMSFGAGSVERGGRG